MIKIEREYNASAIFSEDMNTTWDKERDKTWKLSIFGLTLFKRQEKLHIDYEALSKPNGIGFKK